KKLKSVFSTWSVGDYQVRKLPKSNILIYKVSPHIIVALDSYEKEGVLIILGKRLEENFANIFKELESKIPATPVKGSVETVSKELSLELLQKGAPTKDTETVELGPVDEDFRLVETRSLKSELNHEKGELETVKEQSMEIPPAERGEEIITVSFPVLIDTKFLKKVKDPIALKILNLCDGGHTIDDIAEELKIPKIRVMLVTGDYSAKGVLKYISGIRKIKR
ncbi:MAG: hypothetical protein QXO71_09585, partial [Candidatus Jordarchaeaceae archaeon]